MLTRPDLQTSQPDSSSNLSSGRRRIALLLEYDGGPFCGSQFQPKQKTVQGVLIEAIKSLGVQPYSMMFSGRTDAGVHAKGQVAHFDVEPNALAQVIDFQTALNTKLPTAISVRALALNVDPDFHVQRHAEYKWYRYKIYLAPARSAWMPPDAIWLKQTLDIEALNIEAMNLAASVIEGRHGFKTFQCKGRALPDDVCDIMLARFSLEPLIHQVLHQAGAHLESSAVNITENSQNADYAGQILNFDIVGDRFLYKMVRNLLGQLLLIGKSERRALSASSNQSDDSSGVQPQSSSEPPDMRALLALRDRTKAASAAPANGLSLMGVVYPEPYDFFGDDPLRVKLRQMLSHTLATQDSVQTPVQKTVSPDASTFPDETPLSNQPQMERKQNENVFGKAS